MLVARSRPPSVAAELAVARSTAPTYDEVGAALRGERPAGYHHLSATGTVGHTDAEFARAVAGLRAWRAHGVRGVRVEPADATLEEGATVLVTVGPAFCALAAPCRVVGVLDEPDRFAFAYGTLPGHPERGEECFELRRAPNGVVTLEVRAFSVGAWPIARVAGPLGRWLQRRAAHGFVRSLRRHVAQGTSAAG
jgi:uncharacterized protein (UPF0548 family)